MEFAKTVLPKYVQDMNTIIAKNTNRELVFDPETGIIPTDTQPHTGSAGVLPTEGFEIWAHVSPTTVEYPYSNGGSTSYDISGAGVLSNLKWQSLYDPDTLTADSPAMRDYWIQINNMLHEFGHIFGAGIGEYYGLAIVQDTTDETPLQNISLLNADDPYWSSHPDFHYDPLLGNIYDQPRVGRPNSREQMLDLVRYSDLTAAIISGDYRLPSSNPPAVDYNNIGVKVVDLRGVPINDATVKVWRVQGTPGSPSTLLTTGSSNELGMFTFAWEGGANPHNNYQFLRLIKVHAPGLPSKAHYLSVYDLDEAAILEGLQNYELTLTLDGVRPTITFNGDKTLDQKPTIPKRPTFSGVATPGATVEITVHSDPVTCTTTADGSGNWSCTLPADLEPGTHTVNVVVTNPDSSVTTLGPYTVYVAGPGTTIDSETPLAPNTGLPRAITHTVTPSILVIAIVVLVIAGFSRFHTKR